jgi:Glycosyl hydrolase family 26
MPIRLLMRRFILTAVLVALVVPVSAGSAVRLGVVGDKPRFHRQTGQVSQIHMKYSTWNTGLNRPDTMDSWFQTHLPIPMITLHTKNKYDKEAITPRGLARGRGDRFLLQISRAAHRFGRETYIRPFAEMNGHWNYYCAYNKNGTYRGVSHSTANFKRAFRRVYLIMHGGPRAQINAKLAALNMPALRTSHDVPENPRVKVFWNPQGYGSPNIRKNSANAYYPGDKYVDVFGNDLYDIGYRAAWDANSTLFKSHPSKPFLIGEWGLWGIDDPSFIRHMAHFVAAHPRVKGIVWYKSQKGSIFDIGSKPKSLAAYKKYIVPQG